MGTIISLGVAGVELVSSKNHMGTDHGSLFQNSDRKPIRSDQIDYEYFELEREDPTAMEMAFIRSLKELVPRLELLGFNLARVRLEYDAVAKNWLEHLSAIADDDDLDLPVLMTFEDFLKFALCHPLESLDSTYVGGSDSESRRKVTERFLEVRFERIFLATRHMKFQRIPSGFSSVGGVHFEPLFDPTTLGRRKRESRCSGCVAVWPVGRRGVCRL